MDVKRSMRRSYQFELSLMILLSINRLVETNFGFYLFIFCGCCQTENDENQNDQIEFGCWFCGW